MFYPEQHLISVACTDYCHQRCACPFQSDITCRAFDCGNKITLISCASAPGSKKIPARSTIYTVCFLSLSSLFRIIGAGKDIIENNRLLDFLRCHIGLLVRAIQVLGMLASSQVIFIVPCAEYREQMPARPAQRCQ